MAAITLDFVCDLQKTVEVHNICGELFSGDASANVIRVTVTDGGEPASISGTVSAKVIRADGTTVSVTDGTLTDNVASITLPANAYAAPGIISVFVKITDSDVITTIAAFVANVYKSST